MHIIKGSGIVQIKMHDGMARKLDYWFVSNLRKNLISLDTLAKNVIKYSGESDWVKVFKGALLVMKGNMNQHGIYFQEVCTVRGTMTLSKYLDQYDDKIEL